MTKLVRKLLWKINIITYHTVNVGAYSYDQFCLPILFFSFKSFNIYFYINFFSKTKQRKVAVNYICTIYSIYILTVLSKLHPTHLYFYFYTAIAFTFPLFKIKAMPAIDSYTTYIIFLTSRTYVGESWFHNFD